LVRVTAEAKARALTFGQSERAVAMLRVREAEFTAAIREALEAAADARGVRFEWLNEGSPAVKKLSPARRSQTLGPIFDFAELAFSLDGAVTIFRACVTVCVESKDVKAATPFSKFWTRYMLVTHPASRQANKRAVDLSPSDLIAFEGLCSHLTNAAMAAMAPLYLRVVEKLLRRKVSIDFEKHGEFSVLALDTAEGDFAETFSSLQAGEPLSQLANADGGGTARWLVGLAAEALAGRRPGKMADLGKLFPPGEYQLVAYENTDADRGLFLMRLQDSRAHFVGLTRAPKPAEKARASDPFKLAHAASSSVVSGGLVTQYAMQF
jgi:hypothetical protein